MRKNSLLWIFAILLTVSGAYYTRITGPTKPYRDEVTLGNETLSYKLIRSYNKTEDAPVRVEVKNNDISGRYIYKRTPSHDDWSEKKMVREGDYLVAYIPAQPPAGKVMYQITLETDEERVLLTENPVIIRYRGDVPAWAMIPHILLMFAAMLLSTRAGLAALFKEKTYFLTLLAFLTLIGGGLIFGPIVQKYAFGAFWAGWPWGTDLTDNKTAIAVLFWAYAMVKVYKNNYHRGWVFVASLVLMLIYLIPHSLMGSEIDFTREPLP